MDKLSCMQLEGALIYSWPHGGPQTGENLIPKVVVMWIVMNTEVDTFNPSPPSYQALFPAKTGTGYQAK